MSTRARSFWTIVCSLIFLQLGACARRSGDHAATSPRSSEVRSAPCPTSSATDAHAPPAPSSSAPELIWDHRAAKVPVTWKDPIWGHTDAPVTIVEFTDYQCPFCQRVTRTLEEIRENYGPKKVRIVTFHNPLPFHKDAYSAAVAATAVFQSAGSDAFYCFTKLAFDNQAKLSDESYEDWARACGVANATFRTAVVSARAKDKVDADMALAKQLGVQGVPAFRINGVTLQGAQPYEKFKEEIDAQLAQADKLVKSGTLPKDVYVALTNKNAVILPDETEARKPSPVEEDTAVYRIRVLADDPVQGAANALVTIVVFSDFQCPFCKRVESTLKQVREHYGNNVRIVWKDRPLPFHPQATPAAILARLVYAQSGNQGFWAVHDELFELQPDLSNERLGVLARKHGISWSRVQSESTAGKIKERIDASIEMSEEFNARGTPHFFINGVRLTGAQPFEKFQQRIDAELEKAKELQRLGVAPGKIYEELTKIGKEPPEPERKVAPTPNASRPSRGPKNSVVVIQEWADFQCPFCKRAEATVQALLKEFPTQVRLVWRHQPLPFHQNALIAAEAAEEALEQGGNSAFWKYHDRLLAESEAQGLEEVNLAKIARDLGLNSARFNSALSNHTHRALVEADKDLASSLGIAGAPAFVINGYFVSGAQPITVFRRAIKQALADAKAKPVTTDGKTAPTLSEILSPPARAVRTDKGLVYWVMRRGTGKQHPDEASTLKVHYSGYTSDGKLFDSSVTRGQPFSFRLGQVIRGWTEGVKTMVVGEKTRFWIPPELAYGVEPRPGMPAGTLVFDIELLAIE